MVKKIPKKNNQKKITKTKASDKKPNIKKTTKNKASKSLKSNSKTPKAKTPRAKTPRAKTPKAKIKLIKKLIKKSNKKPSIINSKVKKTALKSSKIIKKTPLKNKISSKKISDKIKIKEKSAIKKINLKSPKKEINNSQKTLDKIEKTKNEKPSNKKSENIPNQSRQPFRAGDHAVYPSHGVGKIIEIENTTIMGQEYSCYMMYFEKERLSIKIPVLSAEKNNLRRIATKSQMEEVLSILRSGIKKLKGMWSRRAQEYETKINSGDIILLAEVLRDLTRDIEDSDRSYSERIIYETAIFRLASEYAIIFNVDIEVAKEKIINIAKDKINSEAKNNSKDDFDDFDLEGRKSKKGIDDADDEEEDEDEEEEEDDFNYNFDEIDDDDDDDDKPKKKRK
jgi:CarD family transcriptional regulator